jgi:predicted Zn-dependent peptidase
MNRITKTIFAVGVAAAMALSAGAQEPAKKQTPPPGSAPKPFKVPARQRFTLPNGMRVSLVPYGNMPKVTVSARVRAGGLNESANQVSVASFVVELMKEGTKTRTAEQIAAEASSMGGALDTSAGADQSTVAIDVLSEFAPKAVGLIADVLQHPAFPADDFERIRNDKLRETAIARSRPQTLANERFRQVLYGDHPYSRILPTEAVLKSLTLDDVKKFYDDNYGAARTDLYVAGMFDPVAVKAAITKAFDGWKHGSDPVINPPKISGHRSLAFIDKAGAAQSTVYMGLPALDPSNPDYVPMIVTNALLGGSFGSRVTANIREAKGYTYSPNSSLSVRYRDGYWVQVADVTTDVTGPAIKEIFYEVNRLGSEPPGKAELHGIKNYLSGVFVLQNSSRQGLIGQLAFVDLHGLGDDYLANYVQKVYAVTPEQVSAMDKKYLDPNKMAIVVVGDPDKAKAQLTDYQAK